MKLASKDEAEEVLALAKKWADNHTMFSSTKTTAKLAVAEYLCNTRGKTLYQHLASKDET